MRRYEQFPDFVQRMPELALPFAGARGWLLQGEGQQVVMIEFAEKLDVPEHAHAEQWEFVVAGNVRLRREGTVTEFVAGDNFFIPAGQPHSAIVEAGYRALILFNQRDRYAAQD